MKHLLLFVPLTAVLGCADSAGPAESRKNAQRAAFLETTVAAEFTSDVITWRLYGVQLGDLRTAVFADTSNWTIRELGVGELLTRNLRLESLDHRGVVLSDADGTRHVLEVGKELTLRNVRHFLDDAVTYVGRGRFKVDVPKLQLVLQRHGLGGGTESFHIPGLPGTRLVGVSRTGVLATMGLEEEDVVLDEQSIQSSVEGLLRGERVTVHVLRRGNRLLLEYEP